MLVLAPHRCLDTFIGMDSAQFDAATHQAYYNANKRRIRLLVYKNPAGWFYQLYDLDSRELKDTPVTDWMSGRTFAKQALENMVGEKVDILDWTVIADNS